MNEGLDLGTCGRPPQLNVILRRHREQNWELGVLSTFTRGNTEMDENRIEGTIRNAGGKVQEGLGRMTGDAKTQAEGVINQVRGSAQDLYGQARDSASQIAEEAGVRARQTASSFENALRNTIESQPYTAVLVALGIGWLLGRTHRPL
jgi:uncharacterized protein YjbJ (UPF0337 family)